MSGEGAAARRRQFIANRDYLTGSEFSVEAFGKTIRLVPDEGAGELCGKLWSVALVLINQLENDFGPNGLKGKRVLELGAGLGAVGIALACAGADVTCTDIPDCIEMLDRNIENNRAVFKQAGGKARSAELWWGAEGFETSPLSREEQPYDLIVGSDLIYDHDVHGYLIWSIDRFLTPNNFLYMSFIARPYDLIFCAMLCDACKEGTTEKLFRMLPLVLDDDLGVDDAHIIKVVSNTSQFAQCSSFTH